MVIITKALLGAELRANDNIDDNKNNFNNENLPLDVIQDLKTWETQVFSKIIITELIAELNEGRHFAITRQAYISLILPRWFRLKFEDNDLKKSISPEIVPGILMKEDFASDIFKQYLKSYEIGVVNIVVDGYDDETDELVPRKYFTGGFILNTLVELLSVHESPNSLYRLIPKMRIPIWFDTEFVSIDANFDTNSHNNWENEIGGIDLDMSIKDRIRTIKAGNNSGFSFSKSGLKEMILKQGKVVVPIIRNLRQVDGLN